MLFVNFGCDSEKHIFASFNLKFAREIIKESIDLRTVISQNTFIKFP